MDTIFFSGLVTAGTSLWAKFSGKFMEILEKEAEKRGETTAQALIRMIDNLPSNLKKFRSELGFYKEYYQQLIYICRDYQTQGLDKDGILKLKNVFVPLRIATRDADQATSKIIQAMDQQAQNSKEKQIWDFLAAMKKESAFRAIVVLGAPGSGKTTLLRHITLTYATKTHHKIHPKAPTLIPVLLYIRNVRQEIIQKKLTLAELITQQVRQQRKLEPLNPPPNWFAKKLRQNQCLVMLDGLDEVADEIERQRVRDWISEQIQVYPNTPFILTSRPFGYRSARLDQEVIVLEVQPFNLPQMKQFIHSWYLEREINSRAGENDLGVQDDAQQQADDLIKRILNSRPLVDMAVNPLLLTMIATVHRRGSALPGKRVELYKEICQVLLERRQRAKQIPDLLTATQKQAVLQVLALDLMENKTRDFKASEKISLIQTELATVANSTIESQDFIEDIRDICGLLIEKEVGVYEFAHLSFQEYLAAVQIKELNQESILINNISASWWHETIRLYAAQSNATNLIRAALENSIVESIELAYDCLDECLSVDPEVRQQVEQQLEQDLEANE